MKNPNPSGVCMCGCGGKTNRSPKAGQGYAKGAYKRYIHGHHRQGKKFPTGKRPHNYGGGLWQDKNTGRWSITCRDGTHLLYYRAVMEAQLGRPLRRDEVVHHVNGDPTDDRLENLELWTTRHPPGGRVEQHLAWAKEILGRYGDMKWRTTDG
jgi:hypothetical protein